jgi:transcriptional regulator with GAF, ATPase, and Fis domain
LLLVTPREDGSFRLRPVRGMGQLPQDEREFPAASLVLQRLIETRGPLQQYDIDLGPDYRALDAAEREWWHNLAMDVYVPVMGRELPIGILALGPKGTGESFRQSELDLLTTLAGQTAAALKNARLFGDMRQLNTEVQLLNDNLQRTNERLKN